MIKYIIVDDEPLAHELIKEFCSMLPHLSLVKSCYNAIEAMQFLNTNAIDFMFLDLNMPKLKGFDFLKLLPNPPKVIVTTAYNEFALEGFELNVTDYLLKPFSFERLLKAVNKAIAQETSKNTNLTPTNSQNLSYTHRFFIKGDKKYHQVNATDILFIEAYGNYTKIVLTTEELIVCHEKISSFDELLSNDYFLRVHKSFIVAIDKIKIVEGNRIIMSNHHIIPIGQTYKNYVSKLYL